MSNNGISDDDLDAFDSYDEEDLLMDDSGNHAEPVTQDAPRSNFPENPSQSLTSLAPELCPICNAPALRDGPKTDPTCGGKACVSTLQSGTGLPDPKKPPNSAYKSSAPPNLFDNKPESLRRSSEQSYAVISRPYSRPNQIRMCNVCHVRPQYQRGDKFYPTCGLSCAAKLQTSEMCEYCKKRPKIVNYGKKYPHCGKTCRDKAKLAEDAAVCTSCILCWKSTKNGESDFCSEACNNLADIRAPFLIEIPRGHVAFKRVAEHFTSDWQTSKAPCPTIKRVYMVVVKKSFRTSFEKYRTKSHGLLQKKKTPKPRWLVFYRECGFGDPGDLVPCSSNRCLLCSILRSSFNCSDFPRGIKTSGLNRAVELYRSGKKSSSKIAALMNVVVGREVAMSPHEVETDHPLLPQNADSVHIIGVRNDGSRVDFNDNIVYAGDAVRPLYLISYE